MEVSCLGVALMNSDAVTHLAALCSIHSCGSAHRGQAVSMSAVRHSKLGSSLRLKAIVDGFWSQKTCGRRETNAWGRPITGRHTCATSRVPNGQARSHTLGRRNKLNLRRFRMSDTSQIALIRKLYDARGNVNSFKSLLADDLEYDIAEGFPNGGVYRGIDAVVNDFFTF